MFGGTLLYISVFKCPNFITIFVEFLNRKLPFQISLTIPRPPLSRIYWLVNFTKKNMSLEIFKKKKFTSLNMNIHPGDSWPYICLYNEHFRRKTTWKINLRKEIKERQYKDYNMRKTLWWKQYKEGIIGKTI